MTGNNTPAPTIPAEVYISPEWARQEKARLWPKVWQMACREEEIAEPGSFYTYDIADESITVVRRPDRSLAAFFNVCAHRGRRLTTGCGMMRRFHCRFHGWQWDLDGKPAVVVDRQDWGDALQDEEITLKQLRVDTWGGWVFVNMDHNGESLEAFLEPARSILDPFGFDKMRFAWRKQTTLPCNWKVILGAFNEGYHTQTTHPQLLPHYNDFTYSRAYGRHGMFGATQDGLFGQPSPRLAKPDRDLRAGLHAFNQEIWNTLQAITSVEALAAGERLMELPEDADPMTIFAAFDQFHREESAKNGTPWPDISFEQVMAAGTDWHIFPNMIFLPTPTTLLGYRSRPNGDDPDSCIFEVYSLQRFAEGSVPKVTQETLDWRSPEWLKILGQDFDNVGEIQKGLKSQGFRGARPSPVQEMAVINFHAALDEYVRGAA
jgi:phenylpropionate dioxygenase-like ring-hydroxylating dioxygenase large terminal subunit